MVPTTPAQDTPVVLVAEDEALVRMMTVDVLEEAGCAVIEAASAEAALSVLDERSDYVCGLVSGPSGRARERRIPRPGNENPSQVNRANLRSKPPSPLRFERFRSTRLGIRRFASFVFGRVKRPRRWERRRRSPDRGQARNPAETPNGAHGRPQPGGWPR